MRKLLLGEDSDAEGTGKDDFFLDENGGDNSGSDDGGMTKANQKSSKGSNGKKGGKGKDEEEIDGEMTYTFVPGLKEDLELKKMQKRAASGLVRFIYNNSLNIMNTFSFNAFHIQYRKPSKRLASARRWSANFGWSRRRLPLRTAATRAVMLRIQRRRCLRTLSIALAKTTRI